MADQHNANIPAVGNQIANDIPDIKENLEYHKDVFQNFMSGWSDTTAADCKPDKNLIMLRDWHDALVVKNNESNPNHQVDVDADYVVLENASNVFYRASSVDLTADITNSEANGLDTGSEASDTWYFIWVIYNGTTVASLLSTSATSPTMPSGYTFKALMGAIYNDSGSNLDPIIQHGKCVFIPAQAVLTTGSATSSTSIDCSAVIPTTAKFVSGFMTAVYESAGGSGHVFYEDASSNEIAPEYTGNVASGETFRASFRLPVKLVTSTPTIYYYVSNAGVDLDVRITGWEYD